MGSKSRKKLKSNQSRAKNEFYTARAYYTSPKNLATRIPELQPLYKKTIVVFGLGCLGAPSVLEFARAGVGFVRLVDYDTVDPATTVRWPIGFTAAGDKKVHVLSEFIRQNYPYIQCNIFDVKIGSVRSTDPKRSLPVNQKTIEEIVDGADLIYDCTAEWGVQYFLADYARRCQIPYIGLSGTWGAWGGRIIRFRPWKGTGCWFCYRLACKEGAIPEPLSAPDEQGSVQPTGCADPTFTGAGFDMLQVALVGVRMAVATLCEGIADAYPPFNWDVVHIRLRNEDGSLIVPKFNTYNIDPNPECQCCHGNTKE